MYILYILINIKDTLRIPPFHFHSLLLNFTFAFESVTVMKAILLTIMARLIKVNDTNKRPVLLFLNFTFALPSQLQVLKSYYVAIIGKLIKVKDTRQVPTLLVLNFTFSLETVTTILKSYFVQ